jgi:hypothetical protein
MVCAGLVVSDHENDGDNPYDNGQAEENFKIHCVSSFISKIYPRTKNTSADTSPSQKALFENLSERIFPSIGAATISLLRSYEYLERFSLCFLFIRLHLFGYSKYNRYCTKRRIYRISIKYHKTEAKSKKKQEYAPYFSRFCFFKSPLASSASIRSLRTIQARVRSSLSARDWTSSLMSGVMRAVMTTSFFMEVL